MSETPNLQLPYIIAAQAQKHVTHNDAIRALDAIVHLSVVTQSQSAPPGSPVDGDRYIISSTGTGAWAGKDNQIAAFQDGAWAFYAPNEGWVTWVADVDAAVVFDGTSWVSFGGGGGGSGGSVNPTPLVGVNATADSTNRLSVSSPASLFNHEGNGHQIKLNKNAASDSASTLFQTGFSGRAEVGTTGDDDFHFKVSPDGTTFFEAILIDKDTGEVTFPNTVIGGSAQLLVVVDEKPTSTNGGTFTSGAWRTRDINKTRQNDITGALRGTNNFTLPVGTFLIEWSAPAYKCSRHKSRLRNMSDSVTIEVGSSEYIVATDSVQTRSCGVAVVTLTSAKTFEIQHQCLTTAATNGLGVFGGFSEPEVYTTAIVTKLK